MLNAGQDKRTSNHQTFFVFVSFFSKMTLTKQKYSIDEKLSTPFSVAGFCFEEK